MPSTRSREYDSPHTPRPEIAILGRAPFTTLVTSAGGGQIRFGPIAVTRWRADPTLDDHGQWCYVRDTSSGRVWSATFQPTCVEPDTYNVVFDDTCASFRRRDNDIETIMEITVSLDEAIEIRKVTLVNHGDKAREIELTTCSEIVIAPFAIDRHHPVFSNLFVQTEWLREHNSILAMRRPRSALTDPVWCGHTICFMTDDAHDTSCETDRMRFIGRGRSYRRPLAMDNAGSLSGTVGAVLDPVFALRATVTVAPGERVAVAFATFMARDRSKTVSLAERLNNPASVEKIIADSRAQLDEDEDSALLQRIAAQLLFPAHVPQIETGTREDLKLLGLTGEAPIILAHAETDEGRRGLEKVFLMQRYLDSRGIPTELVVIPSDDITPRQVEILGTHASLTIDCETFDLEKIAEGAS